MAKAITIEEWGERVSENWEVISLYRHNEMGGVCKCKKCGAEENFPSMKRLWKKNYICFKCPTKLIECNGCGEKFSIERTGGMGEVRDYCYECVPVGSGIRAIPLKYAAQWRRVRNEYGSSCICCGFEKDYGLQFHHMDPSVKEKAISNMLGKSSWKEIEKELDKCVIVCSNCHFGIHAGKVELNI